MISLAKQSFPQTVPTNDAIKVTSELHNPITRKSHLHNKKKKKKLTESTDVVPAKYTPTVKSELFSQI